MHADPNRPETRYIFLMPPIKDMVQLSKLVADQHGWAAAKAFKTHQLTEADQLALSKAALRLLEIFPASLQSSAMMSAALAVALERSIPTPIYVVAGTLAVDAIPVFGDRMAFDGPATFSQADTDWSGHTWVMIGGHIIDIAIFRSAYSPSGPARLSRHVDLHFGPNQGLYVDQWKRTRRVGLTYEPQYVLSAEEITTLMGGAFQIIEQARAT
jgi:hypothetical protein